MSSAEFAQRMVKANFQRPMDKVSRRQLGGRPSLPIFSEDSLRFHAECLLLVNMHEMLSPIFFGKSEKKINFFFSPRMLNIKEKYQP